MTTLLYSNTTKTIGFQLYEYWTYTSQPQACAMAFGILMWWCCSTCCSTA